MLLDSWAWIEFFKGTPQGEKVKQLIQNRHIYTSCLNIAEVAHWCKKNNKSAEEYLAAIKSRAAVLLIEEKTCQDAGSTLVELRKKSPGIGMIDALIYAQAISAGIFVLSGDPHFRNLQDVEFIE